MTHPFKIEFDKAMAEYQPLKPSEVADMWNQSRHHVGNFARLIEQRCKPQPAPVAWPQTPADVRRFLANNCNGVAFGSKDQEPDEEDIYVVSVHDLLSAFGEWVDFGLKPEPQPQQEPVAWTVAGKVQDWSKDFSAYQTQLYVRPVYATPQPQQEPVAWRAWSDSDDRWLFTLWPEEEHPSFDWEPLYTSPPQRQPLTDEEIAKIAATPCAVAGSYVHTFARAIEAAHGIVDAQQPKTMQPVDELPSGFVPLQKQNGKLVYAACMDSNSKHFGWLMRKHPDGGWVSERKLTNWELMQVEDQEYYGIVQGDES